MGRMSGAVAGAVVGIVVGEVVGALVGDVVGAVVSFVRPQRQPANNAMTSTKVRIKIVVFFMFFLLCDGCHNASISPARKIRLERCYKINIHARGHDLYDMLYFYRYIICLLIFPGNEV